MKGINPMPQALFLFNENDKANPTKIITNIHKITKELESIGITHGIYPIDQFNDHENALHTTTTKKSIAEIQEHYGFAHHELASIGPEHPDKYKEVKTRNLQLHWHDAPETRLFLKGGGAFGISNSSWLGICVLSAGAFIQIPAKTYHWFDYGLINPDYPPKYSVVRFWKTTGSLQASMRPHPATTITNDVINWVQPFPTYDVLLTLLPNN